MSNICKFKEITSTVEFNGVSVRFDFYLKAWEMWGPNYLQQVPSKQFFYNTGPTAYDKKIGYKLRNSFSHGDGEDASIFTIWFRNDGCGMRVFKWEGTEKEFDEYKPTNETPYAIQKEWGL